MSRKVSCSVAKKVNSQIRKKIQGALKDLKNDQPRSAATKLYQAGNLIRQSTKGFWNKSSSLWLGHETTWVSLQLCNESTMYRPMWQSRTEAILTKLGHIERKTAAACK
jgi:hypothetical protein